MFRVSGLGFRVGFRVSGDLDRDGEVDFVAGARDAGEREARAQEPPHALFRA